MLLVLLLAESYREISQFPRPAKVQVLVQVTVLVLVLVLAKVLE